MMRFAILAGFLICFALARAVLAQDDGGTPEAVCRVDPGRLWFVTEAAADIAGVDPDLVSAIAWVESHNCDRAISRAGAAGLMQLMPATARQLGVSHPFYIHENVRGGVAYLAQLKTLFRGDLRLVMAAYAVGERPIRARGLSYSSPEVYAYVQQVAQQYRIELKRRGGK